MFFVFFISVQLYANLLSIDHGKAYDGNLHVAATGGFGIYYGGGLGAAVEVFPINHNNHHISFLGGMGVNEEIFPTYSIGCNYGFGGEDRLIIGLLYSCTQVWEDWEMEMILETGEIISDEIVYTPEYKPVITIGYQRITSSGFMYTTSIAFYHQKNSDLFPIDLPIELHFSVGIGYFL